MYYHCRDLKYVTYGKVFPPPVDVVEEDDWLGPAYRWLGYYCGFFPQVWLARSTSAITGFRASVLRNKSGKKDDSVLFGFDIIKGFPVAYDVWEVIMQPLINSKSTKKSDLDTAIVKYLDGIIRDERADGCEPEGEMADWVNSDGLQDFLKKHVFVKHDQVVVPSLNLKVAKKIVCRNEHQKKKLRKMGFIEDRIEIRNVKSSTW